MQLQKKTQKFDTKYERKGATITNLETGEKTTYTRETLVDAVKNGKKIKQKTTVACVNEAKRQSRKLQEGFLGQGLLRVV